VGNHTQHHVNGWHTVDDLYLQNIQEASSLISSDFLDHLMEESKEARLKKFIPIKIYHNKLSCGMYLVEILIQRFLEKFV